MRTAAGLTIFERDRIGLRPARGSSPAGPIHDLSVHHGGDEGAPRMTFASAAATWRSWQRYHQDVKGWDDIGYNLGCDGLGRLYAGRPIGRLPAAVGGHNSNSVALVFIQDGDKYELTPQARATLKVLCRAGIPELGLPPIARLIRDPRAGYGMFGHQEYSGHKGNVCPGRHIMRHVRWLRGTF